MLENLKPAGVLKFFEEICAIPHGSGNTAAISAYLERFARDRGLDCVRDEAGNVVIYKNASKGHEEARRVIIQGHMDMVCEKEDGVDFDFEKDGLRLRVDGDFVSAEGTTLGGDDGIALAMGLALLEDETLVHGLLTVIFTVDEETGMNGAISLNKSHLAGECFLLNLDSEEEGNFLTSCAGGAHIEGRRYLTRIKKEGRVYEISLSGLTGGHSGATIHRGSANAIKVIFNLLFELREKVAFDLISVDGGNKDNAIPRSAAARILSNAPESNIRDIIEDFSAWTKNEFHATDPGLTIELSPMGRRFVPVIVGIQNVFEYFVRVPNGVQEMSPEDPGLVLTSLNAGILRTTDEELIISHSVRSGEDNKRDSLVATVQSRMMDCDMETTVSGVYPAWEYKHTSPLRDVILGVTSNLGMECRFSGIHAGLETGIFYQANRSLDITSFGPDIFDIHTPAERMSLSSVDRCYTMLLELIKSLA